MRLLSFLVLVPCAAAILCAQAPQAQPEALTQEEFSRIHAPILQPQKGPDAAELTEAVAGGAVAAPSEAVPERNLIDRHIFGKMRKDGVPHAPLASDSEFLRRATLDLTGRIPTPSELREFLADTRPDKRDRLIDRLIDSEAFVDKWAYYFMDLFRANGKMGRGQKLFHYWMQENIRADRPYNEVAQAIIAASAKSNHVVAASNVIAREHIQGKAQPDDGEDLGMVHQLDTHDELSIIYGKAFLGINLSCVSCHDGKGHLEKVNVWLTQQDRVDFFRNAAFMGNSRYLMYWEHGKPQSGEFLIDDYNPGYDTKGESMVRVKRFGGANDPAFILTGEKPKEGEAPREALGRMITAHPQFARATVNMFWAKMMGMGIVEPYDEFDLARQDPKSLPEGWELQPTHPELLNDLAADFSSNGYHLKHLFRTICRSSAYQLSARFPGEWKDAYTPYFARKYVRRLSAEELHDSIALATARPGSFSAGSGETVGMAMQVSGPSGKEEVRTFLKTFGQSDRNTPPRNVPGTLLQPIALMQSNVVNQRVLAEKDSRVQQLLDAYPDNNKVVDEMFLWAFSRPPSPEERGIALSALENNRKEGAQDLQWALLNSVEFFFNY